MRHERKKADIVVKKITGGGPHGFASARILPEREEVVS
jgi:hypothetical protein